MRYLHTGISLHAPLLALMFLVTIFALPPLAVSAEEPAGNVCVTCHSGLPERYSQPVRLWQGSIHAAHDIRCHGCHGGDPNDASSAMSPAKGFLGAPKENLIPGFCGRCHIGILKDYLASAHGRVLGAGGPTCVTCHGNHLVLKASFELINEKSCSRCHSFERARMIRDSMQETEGMIIAVESRLSDYRTQGSDTGKLDKQLFAVSNRFHSLLHSVDVQKIIKETAAFQGDLRKIEEALARLDDLHRRRKLAGVAAVSVMLLMALVLHLFRKTYE